MVHVRQNSTATVDDWNQVCLIFDSFMKLFESTKEYSPTHDRNGADTKLILPISLTPHIPDTSFALSSYRCKQSKNCHGNTVLYT